MKKLCGEPRCGNDATYRGRCIVHSKEHDRSILRSGRAIYSTKRWKMVRKRQLFEEPLCRVCEAVATDVDHIIAIEDGGDQWAKSNLQSLCTRHHSQKTRSEQVMRAT